MCVCVGGPCAGGLELAQEGGVPLVYREVKVEQV